MTLVRKLWGFSVLHCYCTPDLFKAVIPRLQRPTTCNCRHLLTMFVHIESWFFSTINCNSCKIKGPFFFILLTYIALRNWKNGPVRCWNCWVIFPCYDAELLITINHLYVDIANQWTSPAICDVTNVFSFIHLFFIL